MRAALVLAILLLAGCIGRDEPEAAPDLAAEATPAEEAPIEQTPPAPPARRTSVVPIVLDGNTGTTAVACVMGPVGECGYAPVSEGASGVLLDGLSGRITGGAIEIAWSAASPATESLSAGLMLMGDACENVELANAAGPSPLLLTLTPAPRDLCAGEVVHLWVAGTTWGAQDPVYYQVDLDQAFHAEGSITLEAGA